MSKTLSKQVLDLCEEELVSSGFRKIRQHQVVLDVSADFLGWVGLNVKSEPNLVRVNPFVGIHCRPIMEICQRLAGSKYQFGRYATYSIHLGELCPNEPQFHFADDSNLADAKRLGRLTAEFGGSWMRKFSSYDKLLPLVESRLDLLGGYPQRLAVGLYLNNQKQRALELIRERQDLYGNAMSDKQSLYHRFTRPFLEMLEDRTPTQ